MEQGNDKGRRKDGMMGNVLREDGMRKDGIREDGMR